MKKSKLIRTITLAGSLLLQLNTLGFQSRGAAGDVDLSFDPGSGVNGPVRIIAPQPDGKVLIVGQFTTVKGLARSGIARLNADGSGDATFNAGTNANGYLGSVALQSDGKMLIGGYVPTINGTNGYGIARLNADGSLDNSFSSVVEPAYAGIFSIVLQSDGKVLIGGGFTTVNGTNRNGLARLNANGSLDNTFNPVTFGGYYYSGVSSIAVQSDGKVLIGGEFTAINGANRNNIARLNANGSLDSSFTIAVDPDSSINLQPDGRVLIGGYGIARFNSNGSPDTNFINPNIPDYEGYTAWLGTVAVQSDGKILVAGYFSTMNGTSRDGIARLNANGSLDSSFNPGTGVVGYANALSFVAAQSDGKVLIGGYFGTPSVRLNTDGSRDSTFIASSFNPNMSVFGTDYSFITPTSALVQSDGRVLVSVTTWTLKVIDVEGDTDWLLITSLPGSMPTPAWTAASIKIQA